MSEQGARILVVDDNEMNRDMLSRRLQRRGFQTGIAVHGQDALAQLEAEPFDLVLLDIMMPVMDGYEVLARLKASDTLRHIPVIMISARDDLESVVRCIELGAEDHLPKPFNATLLGARIGASLEKKRLRDREQLYARALQRELDIGREIQAGFLPDTLPAFDGWDIAATFQPAQQVAGDFYDAFVLPDGRHAGFVIADVCGKGVGAALFMALFRSLIRMVVTQSFTQDHPSGTRTDPPAEALPPASAVAPGGVGGSSASAVTSGGMHCPAGARTMSPALGVTPTPAPEPTPKHAMLAAAVASVNDYIARTHERANMFATAFVAILDTSTGALVYTNAGHDPPMIVTGDGTIRARLETTGPALGLMPGLQFSTTAVTLDPGESLFGFTDGVCDARSPEGAAFGEARIEELLREPAAPASQLLARIEAALLEFCRGADPFDDVTLLAVRRND